MVFRPSVRFSPTSSRKVRGFTLIELMVVVVIIAILATIAVPLFAQRLRGRRLLQLAGRVADIYRGSRSRALGRGSAMVVTLSVSTGTIQVLEGVEGTTAATNAGHPTCGNLPTSSCLTNNWSNFGAGTTVGTVRYVDGLQNPGLSATVTLPDTTVVNAGTLSVCFSPSGRTYYNTSGTWTANSWQTMNGVAVLDLTSTDTNNPTTRDYKVLVMPNGTARLAP